MGQGRHTLRSVSDPVYPRLVRVHAHSPHNGHNKMIFFCFLGVIDNLTLTLKS